MIDLLLQLFFQKNYSSAYFGNSHPTLQKCLKGSFKESLKILERLIGFQPSF